ncbi:hypothetical protein CMQ_5989 [Grosmannia clavigera kw1407]|uniref:Uncharacterized protein n=1 Tax=Grosmannia clavigera (strain kw1407 / UAMH 11150) TaxID=655863 RepID=F0XLX5_GROCL|nr:uncharacterized protein CMQ_5989 [Grosmannia clavigera kw1407]EFX01047.1 hypothetical protein CMQ_5989 [Grosmannia clavigera kw1407]
MTKLGPLTSQALGRSPYDIVVPGEGEQDPRDHDPNQHRQEYDDRGRPVNRETKLMNRDIVRAHNEVMQVIGVAEPDSSIQAADEEAEKRYRQKQYGDEVAHRLIHVGRVLGVMGVWGVNAVRQRILLYRQYSEIPFHHLLQHEFSRQPLWRALETGLPVFITNHALRRASLGFKSVHRTFWKSSLLQFVRLHLQMFLFLQRSGIAPAVPLLPSPLYFLPFSRESPIARPPPLPTTLSVRSMVHWSCATVLNFAPVFMFYSYMRAWSYVTETLYRRIYHWLPTPTNPRSSRSLYVPEYVSISARRLNGSSAAEASDGADGAEDMDGPIGPDDVDTAAASSESTPLQPLPPPPPPSSSAPGSPTTVRRRNTVSSHGGGDDGYASEEEEFELSATLISFDVEAGDANDNAPSAWSAELRQSPAGGGEGGPAGNGGDVEGGEGRGESGHQGTSGSDYGVGDSSNATSGVGFGPVYAEGLLVQLPAIIATDIMTVLTSSALMAPYEAFMIRLVAHAYRQQHGLPVDDLYGLAVLSPADGSLSWTSLTNCVGMWLVHLAVDASGWLLVTGLAVLYRGAEPEWSIFQLLKEKLGYGQKRGDGRE